MLVQWEIMKSNFLVYRREGLPYKDALYKVISTNNLEVHVFYTNLFKAKNNYYLRA
jgi:hypothetical protein